MKEKAERFLYSNVVVLSFIGLFLLLNVIAFLAEIFIGKMDFSSVALLRSTTIAWEIVILGSKLFARLQVSSRKKLKKVFGSKRSFLIRYIADTISIGVLMLGPYIGKLFALLRMGKIDQIIFMRNFWINIVAVLVLGFFVKDIIRTVKRWARKIHKKYKHRHLKTQ